MLIERFRQLFAPPSFQSDEATRIAKWLYAFLLCFVSSTFIILIFLPQISGNAERLLQTRITIGLLILSNIYAIFRTRKGDLTAASLVYVLSFYIGATFLLFIYGGVQTTIVGLYYVILAMSGLFLSQQTTFFFLFMSWLAITASYVAEKMAFITPETGLPSTLDQWLIPILGLGLVNMLLNLGQINMQRNTEQAIEVATDLAETNLMLAESERELETTRRILEARVSDRTAELAIVNSQLQLEREQLAKRVDERTNELKATNEELLRSSTLKDEFLATMSHELRTPLNSILGTTEALTSGIYGDLKMKQTDAIQRIRHSGSMLLDLINDLLDMSKIESGQMTLVMVPVDLDEICRESLDLVWGQARSKSLEVHYQNDSVGQMMVLGDERRIKQIIVNLLGNAIKFTPSAGNVMLMIETDGRSEDAKISVVDTGIGIAEEDISRLFKPFVQLDSALSRQYDGTGLGLVIVKRLAQLHGGDVEVESRLGEGTKFTVTIPLHEILPTDAELLEAIPLSDAPYTNGFH